MNKLIIAGKDGRPSMKGVFALMTLGMMMHRRRLPNKEYWREYKHGKVSYNKVKTFNPNNGDVIIRWGSRIPFNGEFVSYNTAKAIETCTNKKLSREKFIENGVRCPRLITPQNYDEINPTKVIARPHSHAKGKNFVVLKSKQAFLNHYRNGWYYSEFIDKDSEFRVHVVLGKVLGVLQKPRPEDGGEAWNRAINGEAFELQEWKTVKKDIMLQACRAVKALNLDLGAADVLFKDGEAYVVEVNSSPTLNSSPHITEKYAKVFEFIFRNHSGTKLKHWNFEKWQKRLSFFWKDSQLNASNFGNDVNSIVDGLE